ncbi:MAG: ABC-F type ribosomal protection protein [Tissierellia bacterium]|nr:ABC-F type ribosomal protection protein [Tissierellia bacterium]MDD4726675.1 ABC-F type ribosomal protection protein [Tissierellia bacterium]
MQIINIKDLKKHYGSRLVLDIDELKINRGDRIGVVGVNGVGKTTFLEILAGLIEFDGGNLSINSDVTIKYISQLKEPNNKTISGKYASIFDVYNQWNDNMSGGEKTRFKLAEGFEDQGSLMLIDEPTSNLDIDGIDLIINNFKDYGETYLVVSHDRALLDSVCNKILEIENGKVKLYRGNYSKYVDIKEEELSRREFEYEEYIKEKKRLTDLKTNIENKSSSVKKPPKRMGNSEARLHKMGGQGAKKKLDNFAKSIKSRINHLEVKERPIEQEIIKVKISDSTKAHGKILISGNKINKSYGDNVIFKDANFNILNGKKAALIGPNGSGKTTLIKMILNNEGIEVSKNVRIGYFSQSLDILDKKKNILDNVMEDSIHDENFARLILARLLFKGDKVYDKVDVLSGGERVKVSFAKIILKDINFFILDEPTNYLDISSLEVIEELLVNYNGTILIVSHDRRFIENMANDLLIIEDKNIKHFQGKYNEYLESKNKLKLDIEEKEIDEKKMLLKTEISALIGEISLEKNEEKKTELDMMYQEKLEELKELNKM